MSGYLLDVALIGLLVLLNAAFAGSEMALISLREGQLRALEREDAQRATRLARLARDPNRFLATIQIGITTAGFLASATAAVSLAEPLVPSLGFLGTAAEPFAVASVTLVLVFLTLVLGELAPKRLAMQKALPWALLVAGPLDLVSALSRPAVAILGASTNLVVRLFGGRPNAVPEELSPEELRDLVTSHKSLNAEQREIISGALELHERMLREVLVPRGSVFSLRGDLTVGEARTAMAEAGHSRAPVTRGNHLDDVAGVVHWGSLIFGDDAALVGTVATPAMVLPDTARISNGLLQFKTQRQQMAIVIDEHGSVDGIVTLEDLLEEIVGEIYDETDRDIMGIEAAEDGSLTLPGTFPIHDLVDLGVHIESRGTGDTTVAGMVLRQLGRIPHQPGDIVELEGWSVEVLEVVRHAVTLVRLRPNAGRHTDSKD